MSLAVVGIAYPNRDGSDRKSNIGRMQPGDAVELRPEPSNPKDKLAVAVFDSRERQLGYVTAERAPRIGGLLREGREVRAVFQGVAQTGAWVRVAFDGEEPEVPDASPNGDHPSVDDWGC